jgi:hypothetical protein
MVLDAPKLNLLEAVCCSVDVVNGPEGLRLTTLLEISVISNFLFLILDIALFISSFFLNENFSILLLSN